MSEQNATHVVLDVSHLPKVAFGHRAMSSWALMGFIAVEGTTIAVVLASYFYLRLNASEWPPSAFAEPDLLIPSINLTLIMVCMWPASRLDRAARQLDRGQVVRWLLVLSALSLVILVLRWFEFEALHVRWDTNAYGSAAWAVLVVHTLLLIADLLETVVLALFFITGWWKPTFFSDASDAALYQYFLSGAWVLAFLVVFLGPRWL